MTTERNVLEFSNLDLGIKEGNKLIHFFMGYQLIPKRHFNEMAPHLDYYGIMDKYGTVNNLLSENELKYHASWDWLMPVIEKISRLKIKWPNTEGYYNPCPTTFGMLNIQGDSQVNFYCRNLFTAPTLIEAAWIAVVDFVEWLNSDKNDERSAATEV